MKKLLSIILIVVTLAGTCMFGGCNKYGRFYRIEEAYEKGWLTQEDIKSIHYYFEANTDYPEPLDEELVTEIRKAWVKYGPKEQSIEPKDRLPVEEIQIIHYYGTYNSCVVISLWDLEIDELVYYPIYIDVCGYTFKFNNSQKSMRFTVYKLN